MKTVTGKILPSTPISVSKATKIISNFAATDNGASQAVSAYLRRTSASFNELKQLHMELRKQSKSDRKHYKSKFETADQKKRKRRETEDGISIDSSSEPRKKKKEKI